MADKLQKFFKKKKLEIKFKKAGPGHRLDEDTSKPMVSTKENTEVSRIEPSDEAKQAAAAALARLEINSSGPSFAGFNKPVTSETRKELEDINNTKSTYLTSESLKKDNDTYAASGVYFRCPLLGPEILSKSEWKIKIKKYLYEQLEKEKGLTACLIIRNCNANVDKVNACIEILSKYLQNIINNPQEEKYKKIRISNKIFQDKVASIEGSLEFLEAVGFTKQQLSVNDLTDEVLVFLESNIKDLEYLKMLVDALQNAEIINLELDRNVQVLQPSQAGRKTKLPDDFFRYTPEELKKEQQSRTELAQIQQTLRTKAMREKQEQKEMKKYRYALIRIRFPEGIFLQGTFSIYEKYEYVIEFVKENLSFNCNFLLLTELGKTFNINDYEKSLFELRLVPATVLIFQPESISSNNEEITTYIRPDIAILMQNL